jgi:two-component system response regulator MprA
VILDLSLPDGNGLEFSISLNQLHRDLPVLMLTGRSSVKDRVTGFRYGADDYLGKPFAVEELLARVQAILRRIRRGGGHVLTYADVELDLATRTVRRPGIEATLSAREAELLAYFLQHTEQPLGREDILRDVWREEAEDDSNVLNVYVNYLRNKLEGGVMGRLIHTVRGVGYMFSRKEPEELARESGG